jgi:hypothetical protein
MRILWEPWSNGKPLLAAKREGWQAKVGNDALLVWRFADNGRLYWSELNGQLLSDSHSPGDARKKCEDAYREELAARVGG